MTIFFISSRWLYKVITISWGGETYAGPKRPRTKNIPPQLRVVSCVSDHDLLAEHGCLLEYEIENLLLVSGYM